MTIVSGLLSYGDICEIVEILVNTEGRKYFIPGMDHDDIAQEIRLECFRVLEFYDAKRIGPSAYKFLETCIKNKMYNLRRGIWVPNNPPCVRCPMWDKINKTCIIDEIGCDKIIQYRESMAAKAALRQPASMENETLDYESENEMDAVLLDTSIRQSLPQNLIPFYELMINGNASSVSNKIKQEIRSVVNIIINNA